MKKIVGMLMGLGLAVSANAAVIVNYEHTSGTTNPVSTVDGITSTSALAGDWAGEDPATSIDLLSIGMQTADPGDTYNFYFTYDVVNSTNITFASLDLDATAKALTRDYRVSYIVAGASEVFITDWTAVTQVVSDTRENVAIDFSDFTTTEDVQFRVYWSGSANKSSNGRVYVDDFVLNGTVIPEPATIGMVGLGAVALLALRRRMV